MKTAAIVLAAGLSRRMGRENKLLMLWRDKPLITHICGNALASKCNPVFVITGHQHKEIESELGAVNVQFVHNRDYHCGMSTSIRAGVTAAIRAECSHVLILLADMPDITTGMIDDIVETAIDNPGKIVAAANNGKRANPVCWPQNYFVALQNLKGDTGAREMLTSGEEEILLIEVGQAAGTDFDDPAAFLQ